MAHQAKLVIDNNKVYDVIECEYEFVQPIKENGQPAGRPSGGLIHLVVVSPDNNEITLHEWMNSATDHKDGKIVFTVVEMEKLSPKLLHFKRAYCIRLYEYFNMHSNVQMYTKITISAAEIAFGETGTVVFKNDQK
jgi:hypothetical protein